MGCSSSQKDENGGASDSSRKDEGSGIDDWNRIEKVQREQYRKDNFAKTGRVKPIHLNFEQFFSYQLYGIKGAYIQIPAVCICFSFHRIHQRY